MMIKPCWIEWTMTVVKCPLKSCTYGTLDVDASEDATVFTTMFT